MPQAYFHLLHGHLRVIAFFFQSFKAVIFKKEKKSQIIYLENKAKWQKVANC